MGSRHRTERVNTVVIGAGQAGLSVGYHLKRLGISFVILDAHRRVGDPWRKRWDSLRLFTPARYAGLDGMPFPAPPHSFPTKDEMGDYLETYALAPRIATIGWDLGGGWSLQTALQYPGALDAMVMYYGPIVSDRNKLSTLNVPVLGFFAAQDETIPVRDVQAFRSNLMELGKNSEVLIVPRVGHAFASPSAPGYNKQAADEAWTTTLAFLERNLKLGKATRPQ